LPYPLANGPGKGEGKPSAYIACHYRGIRGGRGVIWNGIPYKLAVIPVRAGIKSEENAFAKVCRVDSRPSASSGQAFRGNDGGLGRPSLPLDNSGDSPALALH